MSAPLPQPQALPIATAEPALVEVAPDTASLAGLAPGSVAVIESVDADHPIGRRLLDLGFVPGTRVRVLRRAPLGDPIAYEVRGTKLCLRRREALRVRVRRLAADAARR